MLSRLVLSNSKRLGKQFGHVSKPIGLSFSSRNMSTGSDSSIPVPVSTPVADIAVDASASVPIEEAVGVVLGYGPSDLVVRAVEHTHLLLDIPYWGAIATFTLAIRIILSPINIGAIRNGARMAVVRPEVDKLQKAMKADPKGNDSVVMSKYQSEIKAVFAKHKVNPFKSLIGPIVQMPVFISVFFGMQKIGDFFPGYSTGGVLWFTDLSMADPMHILPFVNAASFLAMIELGADGMPQEQQGMFKWVMRALSVFMIPMTFNLPTGVYVYWTINNMFSVTQTVGLRTSAMKKVFGIPDMPTVQPAFKPKNPMNPIKAFIDKLKEENAHPENAPATVVDGSVPSANQLPTAHFTAHAPPETFSQPPVRLRKNKKGKNRK